MQPPGAYTGCTFIVEAAVTATTAIKVLTLFLCHVTYYCCLKTIPGAQLSRTSCVCTSCVVEVYILVTTGSKNAPCALVTTTASTTGFGND